MLACVLESELGKGTEIRGGGGWGPGPGRAEGGHVEKSTRGLAALTEPQT